MFNDSYFFLAYKDNNVFIMYVPAYVLSSVACVRCHALRHFCSARISVWNEVCYIYTYDCTRSTSHVAHSHKLCSRLTVRLCLENGGGSLMQTGKGMVGIWRKTSSPETIPSAMCED